ncbi:MAG TPA: response regulator [Desulfobacterales bacterium]|nr:response regulator [Desulfobacterales bacterium]
MKEKFNILIGERNPHIREFLRREMVTEGYNVQLAKNGREVLKLVYSSAPIDLLILDPDLPGSSELNLFKSLEDRIPALPLVIHGYFDYLEYSLRLKPVMFVPKQGNSSETLKNLVSELLLKFYPKRFKTSKDPKRFKKTI